MIGAICLRLDEKNKAWLYLAGTYDIIDWSTENISVFGEQIVSYDFKEKSGQQSGISIAKRFDDEYVLRLVETKRYILKMENEEGGRVNLPHFQNERNKFLKCDRDRDSLTFQFINYLGRSRIDFNCGEVCKIFQFEVVPDKMNYEDDYIRLTESIAEVCSELLLDYAGSTSNMFSQSEEDKKILLEQFIFLRQFCYTQNLLGLFESIKRNPDRVLKQEEEIKPVGTGVPSKKFYRNPFSCSRGWMKVNDNCAVSGTYIPGMVAVTHKVDKLDTPANRFVKFALQKFDSVCLALIDALDTNGQIRQAECFEEAKAIHKMLGNILKDSFFEDVGLLDIMPQNNQVLQKREGYSQIFSAYAMIDLALQLDWKGKDEIYDGESKNVALLYEYWIFFELYKIVRSIEGSIAVTTKDNPFLFIEDGITVSLEEGKKSCQSFEINKYGVKINLYYNRTFTKAEFQMTKYEGSYSRPFRPDYTLAVFPVSYNKGKYNGEEEAIASGAVSYIHFDAKYRISDLAALIGRKTDIIEAEEEIADDKASAVANTYKRGDLLKMHTYNDAIRRTIGSYVLYPGSYNANSKGNEIFRLYDEILPGVGAFSIKPGMKVQGENELKSFIVSLIESCEANNSRLNRLKYYTEMIVCEPSMYSGQSVKVVEKPLKKGDMYVMGYIRGDSEKDYYCFLKEKGLLHTGSEFLFYFYAIKGRDVYSHHKDIFRAMYFRFYINKIRETNTYMLEPLLCRILSNELIAKNELVERLCNLGYSTDEESHHADFYYVLKVKVEYENCLRDELDITEVNMQNGNDTFSPHSPKVLFY